MTHDAASSMSFMFASVTLAPKSWGVGGMRNGPDGCCTNNGSVSQLWNPEHRFSPILLRMDSYCLYYPGQQTHMPTGSHGDTLYPFRLFVAQTSLKDSPGQNCHTMCEKPWKIAPQ